MRTNRTKNAILNRSTFPPSAAAPAMGRGKFCHVTIHKSISVYFQRDLRSKELTFGMHGHIKLNKKGGNTLKKRHHYFSKDNHQPLLLTIYVVL